MAANLTETAITPSTHLKNAGWDSAVETAIIENAVWIEVDESRTTNRMNGVLFYHFFCHVQLQEKVFLRT